MHLSHIFAHWSAHLRRRSNDSSLSFDGDGALSLLAGKQRIDCRIEATSLVLRARICNLPNHQGSADQHALLCRILRLTNTHAHQRREFPVLTRERELQLQVWINKLADYEEFCAAFDQFTDALDAWRHTLLPLIGLSPPLQSAPSGTPFTAAFSALPQDNL